MKVYLKVKKIECSICNGEAETVSFGNTLKQLGTTGLNCSSCGATIQADISIIDRVRRFYNDTKRKAEEKN